MAALLNLQKVLGLGYSVQFPILCVSDQFQVVFRFGRIQRGVIACQCPFIGTYKPAYNHVFVKGLTCGFRLPKPDNVLCWGTTGLHYDTMWYYRDYDPCRMEVIGILRVCFLLLASPVSDIRYPKCIPILHWVGVVIIKFQFHLPLDLFRFRW